VFLRWDHFYFCNGKIGLFTFLRLQVGIISAFEFGRWDCSTSAFAGGIISTSMLATWDYFPLVCKEGFVHLPRFQRELFAVWVW
jgi:hypothetical protein